MTVTPKDLATDLPPPNHELDPARLEFVPVTLADAEVLIAWLTSDTWPFHGRSVLTEEQVRPSIANSIEEPATRSFWVILDEAVRIGRIFIEDLEDLTAVASFRIRSAYRGRGIGVQMVRWVADYTFREFPDVKRVEGNTRVDNVAMRRVFRRAGWVAESYYRRSWPDEAGVLHDAVGYAITREDWTNGTVTPVPWPLD